MEPWGETGESRKHKQFPPNDTFGNQAFNLVVTVLAIVGAVTTLGLVGAWLVGTTCGCFR
jgi:hypothetical protein